MVLEQLEQRLQLATQLLTRQLEPQLVLPLVLALGQEQQQVGLALVLERD